MSGQNRIRDAVAAEIKGHAFSLPLAVETGYRPLIEREEAEILRLFVVAGGASSDLVARNRVRQRTRIDLIAAKPVGGPEDKPNLDALVDLMEELGDYWMLRSPTDFPEAICLTVETAGPDEMALDVSQLVEQRLFVSSVRLTFQHAITVA